MRLRDAMLSSMLQQNFTLLLLFGTGVVIAHLLTPRQVGSYSVALAAVNAVAHLKDSAVGSYVVSAPKLDDTLLRSSFGLSLVIAAGLSFGFFGLSFLLADFYRDPALGENLRIIALAQFVPALAFPATMRLMRAMRFDLLLAVGLIAAACQSLVSIGLAVLGCEAAALAWGYFAWAVVTAAVTIAYMPDTVRVRPTLAGLRGLLAFGGWTSATYLVGSTAMSVPELLIGRALGMAEAALFSRAQNLVSSVRNGLYSGMTRPLLPSLGEREGRGESVVPIYLRMVETITGLAWPAYAVLAIWAEPLVRTIYGEAWSAAGTMMIPIAVAHALTLAVTPHYDTLLVKRRQQLLFVTEASVFIVTVVALAIGMTFGISGAVWSLVLSGAYFAACYFFVIKSVIQFPPGALIRVWSRSLLLALVAIPLPLVFRHLTTDGHGQVMFGFAASSAVSVIIWVAAVMIIRHELSSHISALLKRILAQAYPRFSPIWLQRKAVNRGWISDEG